MSASVDRGGALSCLTSPLYARRTMSAEPPPLFVTAGSNPAQMFALDARERACRLASNAGFGCADAPEVGRSTILANLDFAWDPAWLKAIAKQPGHVLTLGGTPVLAHVPAAARLARRSMDSSDAAETTEVSNADCAARAAFVLARRRRPKAGRAPAYPAYKGCRALTYICGGACFPLTRWAAGPASRPTWSPRRAFAACWRSGCSGKAVLLGPPPISPSWCSTRSTEAGGCNRTSSKWGNVSHASTHPPPFGGAVSSARSLRPPLEPVYSTALWALSSVTSPSALSGLFMRRYAACTSLCGTYRQPFRLSLPFAIPIW